MLWPHVLFSPSPSGRACALPHWPHTALAHVARLCRRRYNAMVACADQATLNLTLSLKLRGNAAASKRAGWRGSL